MGAIELLVGAAGVGDDVDLGPVNRRQCLIFAFVDAAGNRRLAVAHIGRREIGVLLTLQRHRYAAHADVERTRVEIARHVAPARRDELDLHAERRPERLRGVDVEAGIGPVRRALGEGRIIARRADAQRPTREDVVEARLRRGGEPESNQRTGRDDAGGDSKRREHRPNVVCANHERKRDLLNAP